MARKRKAKERAKKAAKRKGRREARRKRRRKAKPDGDVRVNLAPTVNFLHEHITEALCNEVFQSERTTERQRKWSLFALARFWLAVVLTAPPSLTHLLQQSRRKEVTGLLPHVDASAEAFFQKCKGFSSSFFEALYRRFVRNVRPRAPTCYSHHLKHLGRKFTNVSLIDGSRLDKIAKRLKILWKERAVILPGCVTAIYDIYRGYADQVWFYPDAAASEVKRAVDAIRCLEPGSLLVGDRLYCNFVMFRRLEEQGCFGAFRYNKRVKFRKIRKLSSRCWGAGKLDDHLVEAGVGTNARILRKITLKANGKTYAVLTNVLEPKRLPAKDVALLYPVRWQVERLFFDLKEVLNLHKLYAANPNAIAMQLFGTAMIHVAFRVAQADIAQRFSLPPEELSPQKLYPYLALASIAVIEAEYVFERVCLVNPRKQLNKPDWGELPKTQTTLEAIRVEHRSEKRRKRRYCKGRAKWKSLNHVAGGRKLS